MCFDIKTNLITQLKRAYYNDSDLNKNLIEKFKNQIPESYFHVSGFSHPKMIIYTNEDPFIPTISNWGLIPFWTKDEKQANSIRSKTLNARGETIFEKPSFRKAARTNRCIIHIDGFYEHHHFKGKTYPFYIYQKNEEPISLGGLWDEWVNKNSGEIIHSFSIITTKANSLLKKIHNNPKLKEGRMPVIIKRENEDKWLNAKNSADCINFLNPNDEDFLIAHNVGKIKGKNSKGNHPKVHLKITYDELSHFNSMSHS